LVDITTKPNELCAQLHNRMPAVLKPEAWPVWLGEEPADLPQLKALLAPYPSDEMICWPVSARVGNVKNNEAQPDRARRCGVITSAIGSCESNTFHEPL
jgi:putative SOS response-associated peptidase YedK